MDREIYIIMECGYGMTEHEICKGCNWNKYPLCEGIKMYDGNFMNIENLTDQFQCGLKDKKEMIYQSIVTKSEAELKIEDLEARLAAVESKTADLSELPK